MTKDQIQTNPLESKSKDINNSFIDNQAIIQEINFLKQEIAKHDEAYHTFDSPLINDDQYDQLRIKLDKLRAQYPQYFLNEAEKIGGENLAIFKKIKHSLPMLSLGNGFNNEDIIDFISRIERFLGFDKITNSNNYHIIQQDLFSSNQERDK
jgi:DNA ligase (NAD+)